MLAGMIVIQTGWRKKGPVVVFRSSAGCARTHHRRRVLPSSFAFFFFFPSFLSLLRLCSSLFVPVSRLYLVPFPPFRTSSVYATALSPATPDPFPFPCDRRLHPFFFPCEICHQSEIIARLRSARCPRRNSREKADARACAHTRFEGGWVSSTVCSRWPENSRGKRNPRGRSIAVLLATCHGEG